MQNKELGDQAMTGFMNHHYHGTTTASGGYDLIETNQQLDQRDFDWVSIGRPFIASPDLIAKFKQQKTLVPYSASMLETFHGILAYLLISLLIYCYVLFY